MCIRDRKDAADIQFDDAFFYEELDKPIDKRSIPMKQMMRDEAITVFQAWANKEDKTPY